MDYCYHLTRGVLQGIFRERKQEAMQALSQLQSLTHLNINIKSGVGFSCIQQDCVQTVCMVLSLPSNLFLPCFHLALFYNQHFHWFYVVFQELACQRPFGQEESIQMGLPFFYVKDPWDNTENWRGLIIGWCYLSSMPFKIPSIFHAHVFSFSLLLFFLFSSFLLLFLHVADQQLWQQFCN